MTETATLVRRGPINGMYTENAALYRLSQPVRYGKKLFDFVLVSWIGEDEHGPESTVALVADERGYTYLDSKFLYECEGNDKAGHGHESALAVLGYTLVPSEVDA